MARYSNVNISENRDILNDKIQMSGINQIANNKPRIFFPNLDGLRFFSFFLVFLSHVFFVDSLEITSSRWYQIQKSLFFDQGLLGVNFFLCA